MSARSHQIVIRLLRGSLALGFLCFLGVVGLYLFGRTGRPESAEQINRTNSSSSDTEFAIRTEGFEFALTRGNQVVFEIEGGEQVTGRDGKVHLKEVAISIARKDGMYKVEGAEALFNPDTNDARLEGNVVVRGPRGLRVETDWLDLGEGGRSLHARNGVRFRSEDGIEGSSDELRADLEGRAMEMAGNVVVSSTSQAQTPFRLEARELSMMQGGSSLNARGDVTLISRGDRMLAQRLNILLDPDTREVTLLRFRSQVRGQLVSWKAGQVSGKAAAGALALRGTSLTLRFDAVSGEPTEFELHGLRRRPALVRQVQPNGRVSSLSVGAMTSTLIGGVLTQAQLSGPVEIVERGAGGEQRKAQALDGEVRFDPDTGDISGLTLVGEVVIEDEEILAWGDRAYLTANGEDVEILGSPCRIEHSRGELESPRAVFRKSAGVLRAQEGVTTILRAGNEASGLRLGAGGGDEPVHVQSEEAIWHTADEQVVFTRSVRAWQGTNTIFADQLRGEPRAGRMSASGNVRTLWQPPEEEDGNAEVDEDPEPTGPMNITSDEMTYREGDGELIYTGSVHAEQAWTSLRCETLRVLLDEEGETRELYCEEAVRIDDTRNGRILEGDEAVYDPSTLMVQVYGNPLKMTDREGGKVEGGRHFIYDLENGKLRLSSKERGASEVATP